MRKVIIASLFFALLLFGSMPQVFAGESGCPDGKCTITNPLDGAGIDSPQTLIGRIINSVLGVVGSLALVMFIYGGLIWMTSSGSSEQVKKGRDILIWAAIGLVIIFSAYGLVRFVIIGVGAGA
ncbi:pilin [Patescibacteria group bacterium]|nr:pilin [Patescibacteria group bacterium]